MKIDEIRDTNKLNIAVFVLQNQNYKEKERKI